jgi:hypothetical protein
MNPAEHFPPPLHNVLPLRFRTWVACYDSLPESQRQAAHLRFYQGVTKKQFARLYGYPQPQHMIGKVEYTMDREWLLARIGEELLAARWTVSEWKQVRGAVRSAGASADEFLDLHIGNGAFLRLLKTLIPDKQQ